MPPVDPREQRVCRLQANGRQRQLFCAEFGSTNLTEYRSGEAGDHAAPEVDAKLRAVAQREPLLLAQPPVRELVAELVHRELADCVGDLSVWISSVSDVRGG